MAIKSHRQRKSLILRRHIPTELGGTTYQKGCKVQATFRPFLAKTAPICDMEDTNRMHSERFGMIRLAVLPIATALKPRCIVRETRNGAKTIHRLYMHGISRIENRKAGRPYASNPPLLANTLGSDRLTTT
jgi:hypothetical protein